LLKATISIHVKPNVVFLSVTHFFKLFAAFASWNEEKLTEELLNFLGESVSEKVPMQVPA
jgi:hypothetical protein